MSRYTPTQSITARTVGAILLLIGVAGAAGKLSGAGWLGTSWLHDTVHLASGLAGLLVPVVGIDAHARLYNLAFGGAYLLTGVAGLVLVPELLGRLLSAGALEHGLHTLAGILLSVVGYRAEVMPPYPTA